MKGLELSKHCYEYYGKPMLEKYFSPYVSQIAAGLAGEGSECFGYDDEISRDHDFGPDFCLWLSDDVYDEIGADLSARYKQMIAETPLERSTDTSAGGSGRRGVKRTGDFYYMFTGSRTGPEDWKAWMRVPDYLLACAVNGEVFRDDSGSFTKIRNDIRDGQPEDVRKKKMAACAIRMAQSGQYNFSRCIRREEWGASMLALSRFVTESIHMIYLLNHSYCPYYKWMFRGLREQSILSELSGSLEWLLYGKEELTKKNDEVERICSCVIQELKRQNLTDGNWDYMEPHAYSIQEHISNEEIGRLHIMVGA